MGLTARGFRYPEYTVSPDIPGDIFKLASDVNGAFDGYDPYVNGLVSAEATARANADASLAANFASGSWNPSLGGGSGATLGSNATTKGTYVKFFGEAVIRGRFVFGSSASFGTGQAAVVSLPFGLDADTSNGDGWFYQQNAGSAIAVKFLPQSTTSFAIRPIKNLDLGNGYDLGTPSQSSQLVFELKGRWL